MDSDLRLTAEGEFRPKNLVPGKNQEEQADGNPQLSKHEVVTACRPTGCQQEAHGSFGDSNCQAKKQEAASGMGRFAKATA